jgi:polyisoprenoid-binding protein YceI
VELDVASLRTGISLRNQHLRDEMEVDRYPLVRFRLDRVDVPCCATEDTGARAVVLHGPLTIKAVTRPVQIPATVLQRGDTLRVRGKVPIRLTDFGIQPPSRLLGIARMRDELVLAFDVVLLPDAPVRGGADTGQQQ